MAKQVIGIGTTANDGTGDQVRVAFDKTNQNFTELYDAQLADSDDLTEGSVNLYNQTHTGDVTGSTTLTIASGAVTNDKMAENSIDSDQYVDASIDTEHFSLTAAINTITDQNSGALKLWSGSQAQYDSLTPNSDTIYFII